MGWKDIGSTEWIAKYGLSGRTVCRTVQLELARIDNRVFSVEGDLGMPSVPFDQEFPRRYLQLGIAEANMVGVAAGLAMRGKIPFVNTFAAFVILRAYEAVCLAVRDYRMNVKLVGNYSGISGGPAATTHYCIEDLAVLRAFPNLVILSPADSVEAYKATWAAWEHQGPVYLRLGRAETPQVYHTDYDFTIGKAVQLAPGDDAALFATGSLLVHESLEAAAELRAAGIYCRVFNMHTINPLDREVVLTAATETGAVVTVEEHNVLGGLGGRVAELLMHEWPVPVVRVGLLDQYCKAVGPYEDMVTFYDLGRAGIVRALRKVVTLKRNRRSRRSRAANGAIREGIVTHDNYDSSPAEAPTDRRHFSP